MSSTLRVHTVRHLEGFSLEPLYLAVQFTGNSLSRNIPDYLPLEISIHVPDEFLDQFTCSLVDLKSCNPSFDPQDYLQGRPEQHPATTDTFPFFPLPPTFNPYRTSSWRTLAGEIEAHLIQTEHEDYNYVIAREFFWMAFVAAFPFFPSGQWPAWNPRINLSGDFIAYWVTDHVTGATTAEGIMKVHEFIWDEFKSLAIYLLPFPIFSSG